MSEPTVEDIKDSLIGAPVEGWKPEDFPQITVAPIPYTSNPQVRPDPTISVLDNDWIYIETGNVRIAIPDVEEWTKLKTMVDRTLVTHHRTKSVQATMDADKDPTGWDEWSVK